jgi:hypothetical protein
MVMKRWIFSLICFTASALAQGTTDTVVPFGFENQSGNGASSTFFVPETQDLFRGSYLAGKWTTPVAITGIAFRVAVGAGSFNAVMPSIEIRASTSSRLPETMSEVYSLNKGSDETIVYSHSNVALSGRNTQSPNPFDLRLTFDRPFIYDATKGSLLMDFRMATPGPGGASTVDIQGFPDLAGSPAGFWQGFSVIPAADIIEFQTLAVPEPSHVSLFLLGIGLFGLKGRRSHVAS